MRNFQKTGIYPIRLYMRAYSLTFDANLLNFRAKQSL